MHLWAVPHITAWANDIHCDKVATSLPVMTTHGQATRIYIYRSLFFGTWGRRISSCNSLNFSEDTSTKGWDIWYMEFCLTEWLRDHVRHRISWRNSYLRCWRTDWTVIWIANTVIDPPQDANRATWVPHLFCCYVNARTIEAHMHARRAVVTKPLLA